MDKLSSDENKYLPKKNNLNATIKFQFRNLDNFIHPDFLNSDEKYVKRFMSTKLSNNDFMSFIEYSPPSSNKLVNFC